MLVKPCFGCRAYRARRSDKSPGFLYQGRLELASQRQAFGHELTGMLLLIKGQSWHKRALNMCNVTGATRTSQTPCHHASFYLTTRPSWNPPTTSRMGRCGNVAPKKSSNRSRSARPGMSFGA